MPVLIVDLYELNLTELFKIQPEQIGNIEVFTFRCTDAGEVNIRNTVIDFQSAVACETVIDTDPAKGGAFGGAGTFEVFIQQRSINTAAAHIADTRHLERRQVVVVAEGVHKVKIDPHI